LLRWEQKDSSIRNVAPLQRAVAEQHALNLLTRLLDSGPA
jgi:hypothetical protein